MSQSVEDEEALSSSSKHELERSYGPFGPRSKFSTEDWAQSPPCPLTMALGTSSNINPGDMEEGELCEKCGYIYRDIITVNNFSVSPEAYLRIGYLPLCSLEHISQMRSCPLCLFFLEMKPTSKLVTILFFATILPNHCRIHGHSKRHEDTLYCLK
jgi:hypothetical protein